MSASLAPDQSCAPSSPSLRCSPRLAPERLPPAHHRPGPGGAGGLGRLPRRAAREHRGWSHQGPDLAGTHVVGSENRRGLVSTFLLDGMTTKDGAAVQQVRVTEGGLVGQAGSTELTGASWEGVRLRAVLDCAGGSATRPWRLGSPPPTATRSVPRRPRGSTGSRSSTRAGIRCRPVRRTRRGRPAPWLSAAYGTRAAGAANDRARSASPAPRQRSRSACAGATTRTAWATFMRPARAWRGRTLGAASPGTQMGTSVNLWDREGHVARAPSQAGATYEAAWSPQGAVCMSHPRWVNLTHACTGRVSPGAKGALNDLNVPVCRSQAEAEALSGPSKAILFNESGVHE